MWSEHAMWEQNTKPGRGQLGFALCSYLYLPVVVLSVVIKHDMAQGRTPTTWKRLQTT